MQIIYNNLLIAKTLWLLLAVLSACGGGGSEENGEGSNGETVSECDVTLSQVNSGAMYTSVADGSAGATVNVWAPY